MTETPVPPPPDTDRDRHLPVGRVVAVVMGAVLALVAALFFLSGAALAAIYATQRDADGFFTTPTERFDTSTFAITSPKIDLGAKPGSDDRVPDLGGLATIRIESRPATEGSVFVGIGEEEDVESYLDGVAHAEISDVDVAPFSVSYDFERGDDKAPGRPSDQNFWAASSEGSDTKELEWELESGNWSVVMMNADASAGVSVDASVGAKADWVLPLGLGLLIGGTVLGLIAIGLIAFGAVGLSRHGTWEPAPVMAGVAPVRLEGRSGEPLSRWLWLVKWLLVIPHVVVLIFLWIALSITTVIVWFAILFTGRYPRGLFDFNLGVLRWSWRVGYYSFGALATDKYPPFTLGAAPDYPATYDVEYPAQLSRGLIFVKSWLLAIPHWVVLGVIGGGLFWGASDRNIPFGGLLGILVIFAALALLFAGRYPRGLFDFVMGLNRWVFRVLPYVLLMRDEYPPFRLDQGESEPPPTPTLNPRSERSD
ncbi:MAG: DUF4389 domain-containing protein [Acidimicrobiia bacterium]|nr:DUF4389 domain-containing protein [Acidimicrobiia bacterium]